jgi:hypothetical protein
MGHVLLVRVEFSEDHLLSKSAHVLLLIWHFEHVKAELLHVNHFFEEREVNLAIPLVFKPACSVPHVLEKDGLNVIVVAEAFLCECDLHDRDLTQSRVARVFLELYLLSITETLQALAQTSFAFVLD